VGTVKTAQTDRTLSDSICKTDLTYNKISDFTIVKPKNAPKTVYGVDVIDRSRIQNQIR